MKSKLLSLLISLIIGILLLIPKNIFAKSQSSNNQVKLLVEVKKPLSPVTINDFDYTSIGREKIVFGKSIEKNTQKLNSNWQTYLLIFSPILPLFLLLFAHWQIQKNQD